MRAGFPQLGHTAHVCRLFFVREKLIQENDGRPLRAARAILPGEGTQVQLLFGWEVCGIGSGIDQGVAERDPGTSARLLFLLEILSTMAIVELNRS